MTSLTISPLQWSDLKDIDVVEPFSDNDAACLMEVRDILKKHGNLERFGVALLHSHFMLGEDEIMLESTNEDERMLITKAVKKSEAGGNHIGTIVALREDGAFTMSWCRGYCKRGILGNHFKAHNKEK